MLNLPRMPGQGFGSGFRALTASGEVSAGGAQLGEGSFIAADTGSMVTGATTTVADGSVVVGGTTIGEGTVVSGGTFVAGSTAAAAGVVIIGALVVAGTILLVAVGLSAPVKTPGQGEEYPGTSLPGGTGSQIIEAPGTSGHDIVAPGTQGGTAVAPGQSSERLLTPEKERHLVEAPGVVDYEAACAAKIKARVNHDHHVFPQEYVNEFQGIGIKVDDYTVTLPWDKHIGKRGLHVTMDWNGEWDDFFSKVPNPDDMSAAQKEAWKKKALDFGFNLMIEAGIDKKKVHPFRKR
jgi:hypothetical protein